MPFNISEEKLAETEAILEARLPEDYREAMKNSNGGEVITENDEWELYPIKDTSDRKRLSRTCNHIINETELCRDFGNFPEHALSIATNGCGDQMVLLKTGKTFKEEVYLWLHETSELQVLASKFSEIDKL